MADARHFCPDCGGIDLVIKNEGLKGPEGESLATASCPNCAWNGKLTETIGAVTSEQFWDSERVGNVLIRVVAVHAAGPLVQALEFIGLLPRKKDLPGEPIHEELGMEAAVEARIDAAKWNAEAQKSRDAVMQRIMEAAITAAFEEAEIQNKLFATKTGTGVHPVFEEEPKEKEFGGNVTSIKKARKKRKRR